MIWIMLIGQLVGFFFIRAVLDKDTPQRDQTIKIETYNNHNFEAEEERRKTKEYDEEILDYKDRYQIQRSEAAYQLGHQYFLDSNNFFRGSAGPIQIASSASLVCIASLSASEYTATVFIFISLHALIILTAISPLFATNILFIWLIPFFIQLQK